MRIVGDLNYSPNQSGYPDCLKVPVIVPNESWANPARLLVQLLYADTVQVSSANTIRYLTMSEQESLRRALRRSVEVIYEAKST